MASPLNSHPNAHGSAGAYTNAFHLAAEFDAAGESSISDARTAVRHYAMLLETRIKANASGRPGPRAITGDYRRSWSTTYAPTPGGALAVVGTNKPQARRLEYGFVGPDRIGRVYNQPPFPHVGPAADAVLPIFQRRLAEILDIGD